MYVDLMQNAALLAALTGLYGLLSRLRRGGHAWSRIVSGLLFGGVAVAGMALPFHYRPGIIYDGRSIIMALAGLFGGGASSIVAIMAAGAYRVHLGGPGVWAGLGSIVGPAAVGFAFRRACDDRPEKVGILYLLGLGVSAHMVMLACQLLVLPWPTGVSLIGRIWLPVMLIFPAATMLMGGILGTEERRVQAERSLKALVARNEALLGAIPDIVVEVDSDQIYRWANPAGRAFFGEDVIGRAADSYFAGEQETYARVQPLFAGAEDVAYVESWQRRRDGKERLLAWWCRVLKDSSGNISGALSTARDITDGKRIEEELRNAEERFRTIASQTPDHIIMQDRDLRYVFVVNPQLGLTEADMLGKTDREILAPADAEAVTAIKRRVLETGQMLRLEVPLQASGGETEVFEGAYIPKCDATGRVDGLIGYFRNITEQRRAEEALRRSARRLQIVHEIDQAILTARPPESPAEAALDLVRRLVPCERLSIVAFDPDLHAGTVLAQLDGPTALRKGARVPIESFETSADIRNGRIGLLEDIQAFSQPSAMLQSLKSEGIRSVLNAPLVAQGALIGMLSLAADQPRAFGPDQVDAIRDMTGAVAIGVQQTRLQDAIGRHTAELEQRVADRTAELATSIEALRAKNEELQAFAYTVSHDLKAPLRGIAGYAQELNNRHRGGLGERALFCIGQVLIATRNLDDLIEDLLRYSRLDSVAPELTDFDVQRLVQVILADRSRLVAEHGIEVAVDLPFGMLRGWEPGLFQALANVIDNAFKYSRDSRPPRVSIRGEEIDDAYRVSISDNGIGFDGKYHDRIFGLFNRLVRQEAFEGTGAGLAIAKKALEKQGGRIWAESQPGRGATFHVEVPKHARG